MPEKSKGQMKYAYAFRVRAEDQTSIDFDGASRDEIQEFVNATLGMMTGGCEACEFAHRNNSPSLFCEKKNSPVNWGSPSCEYFIRSSRPNKNLLV